MPGGTLELRDFRYALRSLKKSPGFAAVAVLSLGLGLGLVTTMFALLDAVTNPYVPYRDADRLFEVEWRWHPRLKLDQTDVYAQIRDRTRSFEAILPVAGWLRASLVEGGQRREVNAAQVPGRFFPVLGVRPWLGRALTDADDGRSVAAVSDEVWRRGFAARRSLAGASITMGDTVYAVVGVMPRGMSFPFNASVWVPMSAEAARTGVGLGNFSALVKVKPGVSRAQADTDLAALARQLTVRYHAAGAPFYLVLRPVRGDPMGLGDVHYAMLGASLAVLLIACANLANLMLARGLSKRREVALRLAVGASRAAVVWQMFAESAVLAMAGAALGAVLSVWGSGILANRVPEDVWFLGIVRPQLSWRVFALSALAAAGAATVFGLVPAIRVANAVGLEEPLKDGAGTTGRVRRRYSALAVAEVALALTLLMGAGLLLREVRRLAAFEYNFPARRLLQGWVWDRGLDSADTQRRLQYQLAVAAAVRSVDGVVDVAAATDAMAAGGAVSAELTGDSTRVLTRQMYTVVTPGYLRVMGLPILEGRDFAEGDLVGDGAVILNAAAAARLYPHQPAVGHMLKLGAPAKSAPWVRIVGVCRTATLAGPDAPVVSGGPDLYVVRAANVGIGTRLLVRTVGDPAKLQLAVVDRLRTLTPRGGYYLAPYLYDRAEALSSRGFLAQLFASMGVFALILAAVGIYGVLAYAVSRRQREFAVRIALGAQRADVLKSVLYDGLVMTLAGTGLGAFLALRASTLLEGALEITRPTDPVALIVAEAVLLAVTVAACLAPALRAMRADPIEILRAT